MEIYWSLVLPVIQSFISDLVRGFSNALYFTHCVRKQNIWEARPHTRIWMTKRTSGASYRALYKTLLELFLFDSPLFESKVKQNWCKRSLIQSFKGGFTKLEKLGLSLDHLVSFHCTIVWPFQMVQAWLNEEMIYLQHNYEQFTNS